MHDSYVNNIEQVLLANETQKSKIEYMERQRIKRENYMVDMQENLHLNKQMLMELNSLGPNIEAVNLLVQEGNELSNRLREYYDEYQNINLMLLVEKQMSLEDKHFYRERIIEFQNKIIDLRKYLHDKEDSFTSVITRLKKYQELNEQTLQDKLSNYKKEIQERHINDFISQILKQKNFYKTEYENISKQYHIFGEVRKMLKNKLPQFEEIIRSYEQNKKIQISKIIGNVYSQKMPQEKEKEKDKRKSKVDPNKELIRLLKKEKLNNQLLQEALNEAIQKNQELIGMKEMLENSLGQTEKKYQLLHSENTLISLRLGQYQRHFCRKNIHHVKFYEQGDIQGLKQMIHPRVRQYAKSLLTFYDNQPLKLQQIFIEKLKWDVEKWSEFICDSDSLKKKTTKRNLMIKSCSVPSLVVGYDIDADDMDEGNDELQVEQF